MWVVMNLPQPTLPEELRTLSPCQLVQTGRYLIRILWVGSHSVRGPEECARLLCNAPEECEQKIGEEWSRPGGYRIDADRYHRHSFFTFLAVAPGGQRRPTRRRPRRGMWRRWLLLSRRRPQTRRRRRRGMRQR